MGAGAYRPTEDASGVQRALLRRLGAAALAPFGTAAALSAEGSPAEPCASPGQAPSRKRRRNGPADAPSSSKVHAQGAPSGDSGGGAAAAPGAAAAAARVAAAVMDAEPRALGARLDALWALLWAAAAESGMDTDFGCTCRNCRHAVLALFLSLRQGSRCARSRCGRGWQCKRCCLHLSRSLLPTMPLPGTEEVNWGVQAGWELDTCFVVYQGRTPAGWDE